MFDLILSHVPAPKVDLELRQQSRETRAQLLCASAREAQHTVIDVGSFGGRAVALS